PWREERLPKVGPPAERDRRAPHDDRRCSHAAGPRQDAVRESGRMISTTYGRESAEVAEPGWRPPPRDCPRIAGRPGRLERLPSTSDGPSYESSPRCSAWARAGTGSGLPRDARGR